MEKVQRCDFTVNPFDSKSQKNNLANTTLFDLAKGLNRIANSFEFASTHNRKKDKNSFIDAIPAQLNSYENQHVGGE